MRFRLCCLLALAFAAAPAITAAAAVTTAAQKRAPAKDKSAKPAKTKPSSAKPRGNKKPAPANAEREKAALKFAKEHHPELVGLLEHLKSGKQQKQQYARAIRDLSTARDRLEKMKERLPAERYDRELESWKQSSRIRLVLARLQMADPANVDSLRQQLHDLIQQQTDDRLPRLVEEKARLQARLKKLNQSIGSLQDGSFVADEVKRLERTVKSSREKSRAKQSAAAKRKPNKSNNAAKKTVAKKKSAGQTKSEDQ